MIPMPVTASANSYNAFVGAAGKANPVTNRQRIDDSNVRQPPAPVASTVRDGDDDYFEPVDDNMYEYVGDDPRVPSSYPNRH